MRLGLKFVSTPPRLSLAGLLWYPQIIGNRSKRPVDGLLVQRATAAGTEGKLTTPLRFPTPFWWLLGTKRCVREEAKSCCVNNKQPSICLVLAIPSTILQPMSLLIPPSLPSIHHHFGHHHYTLVILLLVWKMLSTSNPNRALCVPEAQYAPLFLSGRKTGKKASVSLRHLKRPDN